jgi:hypothetical protein
VIRCVVVLFVFWSVLCPPCVFAKRTAAPKVEPIVYEGVRFTAPNDNGRRAYIQAWDIQTGKKLWEVTVFRNFIQPWMEECVQWVFIKEIRIVNGKLIVLAERDRVYSVDLKTRAVRKQKSVASTSARR